jgi:hypothetical protein
VIGISSDAPSAHLKGRPLAEPAAEARRLIEAARARDIKLRVIGGAAICMQSPDDQPLLPRPIKDIDLVTPPKQGRAVAQLLEDSDYVGEEMFNALRGSRRQLYLDPMNERQVDVFVGEFAMCHTIPIADRLERHPYTVPLAELLLTKLQIVELGERDERDIYSLCYHHEMIDDGDTGIEAGVIARLCAEDWGLWRTCKGTIERCRSDLELQELEPTARDVIRDRLDQLWNRIEAAPKSGKWKRRSRIGERKRWYDEPEEV